MSWLTKRAAELAAKHLNGLGRKDDAILVAKSLAPGIEAVAREFAERALQQGMPGMFHSVSFDNLEKRNAAIAEAIAAADSVDDPSNGDE